MRELRSEFVEFVRELNDIARSVMVEDGTHDATYFLLLPDGSVKADSSLTWSQWATCTSSSWPKL